MMTKFRFIVFVTLLLALVLAACGSEKTSKDVNHPAVRLEIGGKTYTEKVFSYCWPETTENVVCRTNFDARDQPAETINVAAGDSIRVLVDNKYGTPEQVTTTLLDGPGGQQSLGPTNNSFYPVSLENGSYRLKVDATYADVKGRQTFVSYVFGLNVAGATIAVLPSATPVLPGATEQAPVATEQLPAVVTEVPTEVITEEAVPVVTAEPATPTSEPTEMPTELPTLKPTEPPVPTATKVQVATATVPVVEATAEVAAPEVTETLAPIKPVVSATPQIVPSATKAVPTATFVPTAVPTLMVIPPTATAIPTQQIIVVSATPNVSNPATLIAAPPTVPNLTLNFAGQNYSPLGYQYCQRAPSGQQVCVELPSESVSAARISLLRGAAIQLRIDGTRPTEVRIEYLSDTGIPTGEPQIERGDNIVLFSVMPEPGSYILSIQVTWANDENATYYFRVAVSD